MFKARYLPHGGDVERQVSATTEAELRVVLRVVDKAGVIDRGVAFDGDTPIALRSLEQGCWIRPGGDPWGVE